MKSKMIYASSKDAIKKKFTGESSQRSSCEAASHSVSAAFLCVSLSLSDLRCVSSGIKHEWQVNGLDDIQDRATLAEKLAGNMVVSLEGKPL